MLGSLAGGSANEGHRVRATQAFASLAMANSSRQSVSTSDVAESLFLVAPRFVLRLRDRVEAQLRNWRWGCRVECWSILLAALLLPGVVSSSAVASESIVRFDVPSLLPAVTRGGVTADPASDVSSADLMIIEVTVPVTTEIGFGDRENIQQFRFDIGWNRYGYPLVDYAPRTQTTSHIDGSIEHETTRDRAANFGVSVNSGNHWVLSGAGKAELVRHDENTTRYNEVPQHDVLLASGTTNRGTGAFFRLHRSRKETLEGGRDLHLAFRVPADWRAGLLDVKCRAVGTRKSFGGWTEPIEIEKSFVLPVYLESDADARDRAVNLVRIERSLLRHWDRVQQTQPSTGIESTVRSFFGTKSVGSEMSRTSSDAWLQDLMHDRDRGQARGLPRSVAAAVGQYEEARNELLKLSR